MSYAKIRPRRGTNYEWSTVNPVLYEGELGIEVPDSGVGTGLSKFKIGDGVTPWTHLPYAFDGTAASSINGGNPTAFHTIQLRSGTSDQWSLANPVLANGEIAYDSTIKYFKVGDGTTKWDSLSFLSESISDYGCEDDE